ncbi:hypothetical protein Acr_13g0007960 [Actinidia rufa]|uniref:TF-B3 domain-containing protein n=1 Tax=Actinidia rufa TaxID=165716 RepID=A0A7J0FKZ9_9ERIC|nr:hypothetical protein Acr_13g0007960 [Actinidia rufa]
MTRQRAQMREDLSNRHGEDRADPEGDTFLFETEVTLSNRLLIPVERAIGHFPFLLDPEETSNLQVLHLTVPQTKEWIMPVIRYADEDAFMFTRLWPQFVKFHNLKTLDKIRFYKPYLCLHTRHYVVAFKRSEGNVAQVPKFRWKKFLFQLEMTPGDVGHKRLFIHNDDVMSHFPLFYIPEKFRTADIIKFTDAHNKDWYMDVMRYSSDFYVIIEGWDGFVKERNLKAKDVIKFYEPVQPSHEQHFLIECVRNEDGSNPTQPGSTKNESEGK